MWSPVEIIILCTISEPQLQQAKYVIHIDVLPKEKAADKLKKRKGKGFTSKTPSFIGGGKSDVFKIQKGSVITFETEGALHPKTKFKEGQNKLKCTNIKKEEVSRQIYLVPDDSCTDDHAAITFHHNEEFLYQVTITGIRREETAVERQMSVRSNTLSSSGSVGSIGNEVLPVPPRPPGQTADDDVVSVRTGRRANDDDDDGNDEVDGNIRRRNLCPQSQEYAGSSFLCLEESNKAGRIFSDKSLEVLANALGPAGARRLLKQLNMADADIQFELNNHQHDCCSAYANLFSKWRNKEIHRGDGFLKQELSNGLKTIGRNDIRMVFKKCADENIELRADELKG